MQWFRLHNKLLNDPVVQGLTDKQFKVYINLLCHASAIDKDGYIGSVSETAFALRETKDTVSSCFMAFQEAGLLVTSVTDGETFHIPQWKKKQYKSDTSTDRVRRHREKVKRSKTVTETPPDTDTDTEQKQTKDKAKAKRFVTPTLQEAIEYFREKADPFPEKQAERFMNFYESKGWMVGRSKMKDWKAAVRNWISRNNDQAISGKPQQQTIEALMDGGVGEW